MYVCMYVRYKYPGEDIRALKHALEMHAQLRICIKGSVWFLYFRFNSPQRLDIQQCEALLRNFVVFKRSTLVGFCL